MVPVRLMREPCFGLFAYVVRREAAEALLADAFPISGQVDHAISSSLLQRGRCFQAEPKSMIFFSPKSEEAEDSDIQTMATATRLCSHLCSHVANSSFQHRWRASWRSSSPGRATTPLRHALKWFEMV